MSLHTSPIRPTLPMEPLQACRSTMDRSGIEASVRWVDPVLGTPAMSIKLLILDEGGRFRIVFAQGVEDVGGHRSMRRREAIVSERPCLITLRRTPGRSLTILPLVCRGEVLGVLEVAAADHVIGERLAALEAVAGQTAVVLSNIGVIRAARRIADATADVRGPLQELLTAASREHAVGSVVLFCCQRVGVPAEGWLRASDGHDFRLVASRGIDRETKEALRRGIDTADAEAMVGSGGHILDGAQSIVTRAGNAVVLVKDAGVDKSLVKTVEAGLGLALDRLALSDNVADLAGSMDVGLAWTAHEVRAPLLGVVVRGRRAPRGGRRLGLFIAQRIVQAHGGALWLDAASDRSVFRMRFPRVAA